MFKKFFYKFLLVIIGLLLGETVFSQSQPNASYNALPDGFNDPTDGLLLCPNTISTYRVDVTTEDAGTTWFEWVVYGGTIIDNNGSPISLSDNQATGTQMVGTIPYFYISHDNYSSGDNSSITVQWHSTDVNGAWVAVRQHSEWGCYAGPWSVYTNDIKDSEPAFTNFPTDITISNDSRLSSFILPLPGASDPDADCPFPLTYSYTVTGASAHGPTPATTDDGTRAVVLGVGVNTVTWTISDGYKSATQSYTITVDPVFSIGHVAWIDPYCVESSPNSGSALVTATSLAGFPVSSTRQVVTEYNFDNLGWTSSAAIGSLADGNHTVEARLVYSADTNNDGALETLDQPTAVAYSFTLHATSAVSANGTPAPGGLNASIKNTSCLGSEDGIISITRNSAEMVSQNRSVSFDGSSSYLLLNKFYDGPISSFSVGAWIKTTASSGTIVSFDNSEYFHLGLSTGFPQLTTRTTDNSDNQITVDNVNFKVNDGQWHLVVATYSAGTYTIYVDGVSVKTQSGGASVGKSGVTRYGMIGALSKTATFSPTPSGSYFSGNIAQVSIWDDALAASDVQSMYLGGMSGTDQWVLNDVPSNVSGDAAFSDCGNLSDPSEWARFYNCTVSSNDAPILLSWGDDADEISTTRDSLPVGIYTLQVRDLFGCGEIHGDYEVKNGDDGNPYLLWDAALVTSATASQSTTTDPDHPARLANDGLYDTYASTGEYWDIDLGNSFPLGMVRVTGSASGDAWAMVSTSAFSGATLEDDTAAAGVYYKLLPGGSGSVVFDMYVTHVRIRTVDGGSLELNEVEVLTYYQPAELRKLYLTEEGRCSYDITIKDVVVDPVVYDGCEGTSVLTNNPATTNNTLVDQVSWAIGTYTENWHAVDDNGLSSNLTMRYEVVDEQSPEFVANDPFDGFATVLPHCDALTYLFPIPAVTDNFMTCSNILSIRLYYDDDWTAYSVDMDTYDPNNPGSTTLAKAFVKPGNRRYQWRIEDANHNWLYSEIHTIHIEQDPVLNEVRIASSCSNSADYTVYFSSYESEPSATVEFILHPVSGGADVVSASPEISGLAPGTYKATIRVNGCVSNTYSDDVVIPHVTGVALDENITNVQCLGNSDGSIDLSPSGGSQTNIIHFKGGGATATGADAGLDLGSQGMIECWFFLDSLSTDMNWNTNLFGVSGSYGLRMVNGALQFYAGAASVSLAAGDIVQRTWYHIAGSYSWDGSSGTISLYRDGTEVATNALAADPAVGGGSATIGGSLNGFVRNARVWNIAMPANFGANINLYRPIDPGKNLVVNYPANETGGDQIYNYKTGSNCSVSGSYSRQKFAYYWQSATGFLSFDEDITLKPTGGYTVSVYDPLGCTVSLTDTIRMDDDDPPTMMFYSDHARSASTLGVGEAIVRYDNYIEAPGGGGNAEGDCAYYPFDQEFDPRVNDGVCPATAVTLSFNRVSGNDWGTPAPATGAQSLNGVGMNGIITLEWTATDPNGLHTSQTVSYYIVDDQAPSQLIISDSVRYTDTGSCTFTVPASGLIPQLVDNCSITTGILQNSIDANNTLAGVSFVPGTYNIMWTYQDRVFPGITPSAPITKSFTLHVIDHQQPVANCHGDFDLFLDEDGLADVNSLNLDDHSTDNCGKITAYRVTKNIVPTDTTSTSRTTVQWQANLIGSRTIFGLNVTSPSASGFWVLVSTDGVFGNTGDLTENGAVWDAGVTYSQYYSGMVSGSSFIEFNRAAVGQYVRIWLNGAGPLDITDVEVYGSETPASTVQMNCDDVRYSATPTPTFSPVGVLLTVIDEDGNASSCMTNVTVRDEIPPDVIAANDLTFSVDDDGVIDLNDHISEINNGSSDICGIESIWVSPNGPYNCLNLGNISTTLNVRDIYGNVGTQPITVAINDEIPPVVRYQTGIQLYLGDDGTYEIDPRADIDNGSTDNCTPADQLILSTDPTVVTCSELGNRTIRFYVRDLNGSESFEDVPVTVLDVNPPTGVLNDFELTISSANTGVIHFEDLIPYASIQDNCTSDFINRRFISYNVSGNWCAAGNEGTSAPTAFTNIAADATVTGTANYGTYVLDNVKDNDNNSAYISGTTSGAREIIYDFGTNHEFNASEVLWHTTTNSLIPTIRRISHEDNPTISASTAYTGSTPIYNSSNLNDDAYITSNYQWIGPGMWDWGWVYDYSNTYITDAQGTNASDEFYVVYDFGTTYTLTRTIVSWFSKNNSRTPTVTVDAPTSARLQYWDGTQYLNITGVTLGLSADQDGNDNTVNFPTPVETSRLRIVFDDNNNRVGIEEWQVWGYAGARQYECSLPTSAVVQWDNSGTWTNVPTAGTNTGVAGLPNMNHFDFSSVITTSRLKLVINGDSRRVGVKEWRILGRDISANSACISFNCTDVGKDIPVYLRIVDQQGLATVYNTTVHVKPYFSIDDIQVHDCGVSGEVFTPTISNTSGSLTYSYLWTTLTRPSVPAGWPYYANEEYSRPFNNSGTYSTTSTNRSPTLQNRTVSNNGTPWDESDDYMAMVDGDYVVNFRMQDQNGCFANYPYSFGWDSNDGGGADSYKNDSVCINQSRTYEATPPPSDSYWSYINYDWTDYPSTVTLSPGSGAINQDWATFNFPNAGIDIPIHLVLVGMQWNLAGGPYTSDGDVVCSTDYPCRIVESTDPFNLLGSTVYTSNHSLIPNNATYVRTNQTSGWWECREEVTWRVDVYDVPVPQFAAYSSAVCFLDTVTYRIDPSQVSTYDHYSWAWTHGRHYAGGNATDNYITIIWDDYTNYTSYYPGERPSVTVTGFNKLNCSKSTTISFDYSGSGAPVLGNNGDCSSLNVVHAAGANSCEYTFQNLPAPVRTDDCYDRIESYWNSKNNGKNAAGPYNVGHNIITWHARDYNGNEGTCTQQVDVYDNEPPKFNFTPPAYTTVDAASNECAYTVTGTGYDVQAYDNCSSNVIGKIADVYWYDPAVPGYVLQNAGLTTLDGYKFGIGRSHVVWTVNDGVDNTSYGLPAGANSTTFDFYITVEDNTDPVFNPVASISTHTDLNQNYASYASLQLLGLGVPQWNASQATPQFTDNCSDGDYLNSHVELVTRSDGAGDLTANYKRGITVLTWRVTDESGNSSEVTQTITISDEQPPWFETSDADLQDVSVSYCKRIGYRLNIPTPYDNCGITNVRSITYKVTRTSDNAMVVNQTINRVNGAFNPNGTDLTDSIPNFYTYVYSFAGNPNGTDFTVTWSAIDESNNVSADYSYNLHVEIEPVFSRPEVTQMSCGGAEDGSIAINISPTNTTDYHYDRNYLPQFSIDLAGASWYPEGQTTFEGLKGGKYKVRMMVNGCLSASVWEVDIDAPTPYSITAASTDVLCHEDETGTITLTMSGGAAGQLHFTGSSVTAAAYAAINLTTEGAYGAWVYLDGLAAGTILSKDDCSLTVNAAGNFSFTVNGTSAVSSFAAVAKHWYYVTGSWDGSNVAVSVGGNDVSVSSSVASAGSSAGFSMGGFSGILRDVKIWNSASMTDASMVGYWRLNNGSGDTSPNKSTSSNPSATAATGCAGLWTSNLPQPGTYTWTRRNGSFFSNEINLTNLGIDTLNVSFVDPYGCPNPELTLASPVIIHATDKIAPVIQKLDTVHVLADNACEFVVGFDDLPGLIPTITDAAGGSCEYDVTWKLVTMPNKDVLMYYDETYTTAATKFEGATLGRKRLNGANEVTVTATQNVSQNDSTYSTWTYYIDVQDKVPPVPDGRFDESPSMDLNASGQVLYTAKQFNRASTDNCSDPDEMTYLLSTDGGTTWDDTIQFDCNAIGTPVNLSFMVIDEAGNEAVEVGSISLAVRDVTPPVISKNTETKTPYCAIHDANGGVPAYNDQISLADFVLKATDYSDNCGVTRLRYKLEHDSYTTPVGYDDWHEVPSTGSGHSYTFTFDPATMLTFYEGTSTITFEAADGSDALGRLTVEKIVYRVTVSPKPTPKTNVQ